MNTDKGLLKVVLLAVAAVALLYLLAGPDGVKRDGSGEPKQPDQKAEVKLDLPVLSDADFDWIAARIYQNEALSQARYLTFWGKGEDFPSFGIGHFIWFPDGVDAPFDEMFPDMVSFVKQRSMTDPAMPVWLSELTPFHAPWTDKQQFDQAWSSGEMTELRDWLEATAQLQARFIVATFSQRWRDLELPEGQKQPMTMLLQEMADTAEGLFAIIDYYNFKGLGVNPRERYQDQGWGLIQVLQAMAQSRADEEGCVDLVEQFRQAAAGRLSLRVENSPAERNESRWLEGWHTRLQGYVGHDTPSGKFAGPGFRVKPYLQNPDKHAVTLTWFSNESRAGQVVVTESTADETKNSLIFDSSPVLAQALTYHPAENQSKEICPMPLAPYLHQVRLTGLEAGKTYLYQVSQDNEQVEGTFQTSPGVEGPLRFIVYADSETEPESTGKHAAWPGNDGSTSERLYPVDQTTGYTQNLKVIEQRQPAFVAIAGDLVQSGGEQRDWDEFWAHNSELAASVFIIPALGNHDYFGGPGVLGKYATEDSERAVGKYKTYFDLPGNGSGDENLAERYYVLNYGVVTLIVIDGTDSQPHRSKSDTNWRLKGEGDGGFAPDWQPGSEQHRWLENELQRAQSGSRFTFVMFHGAPWTSGVHGKPPGEQQDHDILSAQPLQSLTPLFLAYGVDAVFNGHDEMYEHSIVPGFEVMPGGDKRSHEVHFYDIGIGGDGLRGPVDGVKNPHRRFLAHSDAPEVYGQDGVLLDGGKHYGHLEVNIGQGSDGQWKAQLDAVYIFPLMAVDGQVLGFERRLYDDSHTLIANPLE